MRRILVVVAMLALLLVPTVGASADPPDNPFLGPWVGVDPDPPDGDGSTNWLRVGGGNNHAVYQEDALTVCNEFDEERLPRGYLSGLATIADETLMLTGTWWCIVPGMGRVHPSNPMATLVFTDQGDGTLMSGGGVCYHRPSVPSC